MAFDMIIAMNEIFAQAGLDVKGIAAAEEILGEIGIKVQGTTKSSTATIGGNLKSQDLMSKEDEAAQAKASAGAKAIQAAAQAAAPAAPKFKNIFDL